MIRLYEEEFIAIGWIRKGHGYKGHAKIILKEGFEKELEKRSFLFLEIEGYKVPFPIENFIIQNDIIIKLDFIDSVEDLKKYQGKSLFLLKKELYNLENSESHSLKEKGLEGWTIQDQNTDKSGIIKRVDEYPQQLMAVIVSGDTEHLIPLHPDMIIEVKEESKLILMDLPEGLF